MHTTVDDVLQQYDEIYAIISPPRCSSTALARAFWKEQSIGFYSHEPFEKTFHHQVGVEHAYDFIRNAQSISEKGNGLIIKEMAFQVHPNFENPTYPGCQTVAR